MKRRIGPALVAALALFVSACGARLTSAQQQAALSQGGTSNNSSTGNGGTTSGGTTSGTTGGSTSGGTTSGITGGTTSGGATSGSHTGTTGGSRPVAAPSCSGTGGASDVGITKDTVKIGVAADISGPVPGLFQSAEEAVKAFVNYFNASFPQGICGRHLKLDVYDSQTSAGGASDAATQSCKADFAFVGSMSAFDQGFAGPLQSCGEPDIPSTAVNAEHQHSTVTFGAESTQLNLEPTAKADYFVHAFPDAVKHAAYLYINASTTGQNEQSDAKMMTGRGFHFDYEQGIDISDYNYGPYVQQMKSKGVKFVEWLGAYQEAVRLAQAMQQQSFKPDVFLLDPTGYDPNYVQQGGAAVNGTIIYDPAAVFEEASGNAELSTYVQWLQQVAPGHNPSFFGEFSWSATRLFTTLLAKLGANPTRKGFLAAIKNVHDWTDNGMHSPQDVGGKRTGACDLFIKLEGSTWHRVYPSSGYSCGTIVNTGVGG